MYESKTKEGVEMGEFLSSLAKYLRESGREEDAQKICRLRDRFIENKTVASACRSVIHILEGQ